MRRLDIGIASYGSWEKLKRTLNSIQQRSRTDWRCFVMDNPGPDVRTRPLIQAWATEDRRIIPVLLDENVGYAGAVCKLMELAETEYLAYCDNDIVLQSTGWDETLCSYLDRFHEIGMIFPNGGPYPIQRDAYTEVMWGVGFCWILNRLAMKETGEFDTTLGHQEEADYCLRLRMAGYRCAAASEVSVSHDAAATSNPKSDERINRGVIRFVNKWTRYFGGKNLHYHSPNVLRWEDWPPNALYLEEYFKQLVPDLNLHPEKVTIAGQDYDLLKVPRFQGFYGGRII
jgi:GT2 family glycosyltransferase